MSKPKAKALKQRFCSTGSHWTTQEFRKIGVNRWICLSCYARRKTELKNLAKNRRLARRKTKSGSD